ncbi:MAG: aminodeoxychorismate/anthranilate synthase component II [Parachlamydiales bacterium]
MSILLLDNYDSFTYNIVHALWGVGAKVNVIKNDEITVSELLAMNPPGIVIGPGPGCPKDAGISLDLIRAAAMQRVPLLGICLGMQAIGEAFGGVVCKAEKPMHGKLSPLTHLGTGLFKDIPNGFLVTRYHSLVVEESTLPPELIVTARTSKNEVMALKHSLYPIEGVQFHPEAVASEYGPTLFFNWIRSLQNN